MKTCRYCGCYVPDGWDNCPACGKTNKTIDMDMDNAFYRPEFIRIIQDYMNELYKMEIKYRCDRNREMIENLGYFYKEEVRF